jgi:hypothetical protein
MSFRKQGASSTQQEKYYVKSSVADPFPDTVESEPYGWIRIRNFHHQIQIRIQLY